MAASGEILMALDTLRSRPRAEGWHMELERASGLDETRRPALTWRVDIHISIR